MKILTDFGHLNLARNISNIRHACTLREISKGAEFTWVKTMETSVYKWEPMELKDSKFWLLDLTGIGNNNNI